MADSNQHPTGEQDHKPRNQTGEEHGSVKKPQRGEDDFRGKSDTPRGSEPEIRGSSGPRG